MALGFLKDIADVAETVTEIAGPVGQIIGAIRGPRDVPQVQPIPVPAAETESIALLRALADPGNELIQQLQREEFEGLTQALSQGLRAQVLAGRREESLGRRRPFFDPERQDEALAFQLSRGLPALQQQARQNAINRVLAAAGVGQFAGGQQQRTLGNIAAQGQRQAEIAAREQAAGGTFRRAQTGIEGLERILEALGQNIPQTSGPIIPQRKPSRQVF